MKNYLIAYMPFIGILALIIFLVSGNFNTEGIHLTWMIYLYFIVITILFHFGIVKTTQSRPQVFIRYYMGATTIKLLLHLGIIVFYSMMHKESASRFIITFMIMYLLFTVFEVAAVWVRMRRN
jgi:hypothetical protein